MKPPPGSEDELIDWLQSRTSDRGGRWIGDDAAILPSHAWAVTVDSQIENVHFLPGLDPAWIARRLLAVNLSDIAAMGATPAFAFLALAAPDDFDRRRFFSALIKACDDHDLNLAGGDLSKHGQVMATLTLLGSKPAGGDWLRRGAAVAGERLWLGGTLGEAALGLALLEAGASVRRDGVFIPETLRLPEDLRRSAKRAIYRHLLPRPQLALGHWLGRMAAGAAIDLSDGLARDLHRLCARSEVGAEVFLDRIPLAYGHKRLAHLLGRDWEEFALAGGEDYILLFSLPPHLEPPSSFGCAPVGNFLERCASDNDIVLVEDGIRRPLAVRGWDHLTST